MRRLKKKYNIGDERIVTRFLLLPLTIDNEQRWLEKATIKEKATWDYDGWGGIYGVWKSIEWINK